MSDQQDFVDQIAAGIRAMEKAGEDPFALGGVDTRYVLQALAAKGREDRE